MKAFKTMKISFLVVLYMIMGLCSVNAEAKSGTCGEALVWTLEGNVLEISGTGEMTDWTSSDSSSSKAAPWSSERSSIKEVIIQEGVTTIGAYAFAKCTALKKITIPQTVSSSGDRAFFDATQKKNVYISDLSKWCEIDFYNATANPLNVNGSLYINNELVKVLVIPDNINVLKDNTFHTCENIEYVIIPDSVTSIGKAFYNCATLKSVTLTKSIGHIHNDAFIKASGSWVQEINYSGTKEQWGLINNIENSPITEQINYNRKTKSVIDNGIIQVYPVDIKIGEYIFIGCYKDNQLVDCKFYKYNNEEVVVFSVGVDCDAVKIFAWNSLGCITPISNTESLNN